MMSQINRPTAKDQLGGPSPFAILYFCNEHYLKWADSLT